MPLPVRKAVFPVAGLGTRSLPATKAIPKEMLAVVDKPLIQYAVEEAQAAGIEEFIFVTGRGKSAIEDHFDRSFELESALARKGDQRLLKMVREISDLDEGKNSSAGGLDRLRPAQIRPHLIRQAAATRAPEQR